MELTKNELSIILEAVGNRVRNLDEAIRGSEGAHEEPTVLKERLEESTNLYQKVFNEIYAK